ncbi:PTS fructose transporter subunit IIB [Candidatus Nanohalovita haloferacivicina]|uniref:PTS fructose transporter subunit IIB n=1 Tax=Candidatus Nanohalovita haloferacivicina TaxID=2978046 RepID=UPI00325F9BCE|nr:Fructose PTS system EIIB component [Candidatus Nanohalobia archaeon BNXNv]
MKLVAVTGCPTGIAHSQMAAESLEEAVKDSDDEIKVEVHGSSGTENVLEDEDIEEADAAIVASDISVPTERFEDMPSVHTEVQAAVTDAEALIEKAKEAVENGENRVEYKSSTNSMGIMKKIKELLP